MTDLISGPDATAVGGNVVKKPEAKLRMKSANYGRRCRRRAIRFAKALGQT